MTRLQGAPAAAPVRPVRVRQAIAGVWLVAAQVPQLNLRSTRTTVAGVLLAIAGLLLVIATHWGKFG